MKSYFVAFAFAMSAGAAQASIIPTLDLVAGAPVELSPNRYAYTYTATLASEAALTAGNYFTLYDFGDFVRVNDVPTDWSFSIANLGETPDKVLPEDDPKVRNITFTYNGPTLNDGNGPTSEITFSPFTIVSASPFFALDSFTSLTIRNSGEAVGTSISTIGQVAVPLEGGGSGSTVPEPASWAMLIAGFGLVGSNLRRRRNVAVAA